MSKYKVVMCYPDGTREEDEDIFATRSEADMHGLYLCSCYAEGGDILNLSNPGDYPLNPNDHADFEIIEILD